MDRKKAKQEYLGTMQPMGIVQITNLTNGRCYLMRAKNTRGIINSLRFQLKTGAFAACHELCRDFKELGEENFTIAVLDELQPVDDPDHDYDADLQELEALWLERLQPYGEKGYHSEKSRPKNDGK